MRYVSTRGQSAPVGFVDAVLGGLAPDGGLYVPQVWPLFTRAEIMAGLKKLAPYRESTLLVTNLRPALIPPTRRATPRRKQEYEEALAFIRQLAAARTVRGANLQLLFL